MKELEEIAAAYHTLKQPCALATVVSVSGSSYRLPGARMLVSGEGKVVAGCVSGGCLEADIAEHGRQVIATGEPRVLTYDTSSDASAGDELLIGLGTGCEGTITILVEKLEGEAPPALILPLMLAASDEGGLLSTTYKRGNQSISVHEILDINHMNRNMKKLEAALHELIEPSPHFLLCGAGPDSLPLARLAREILGWRVTVADHRAAYADATRYASGVNVVLARPDALSGIATIDSRTAVVLMTHDYSLDRELLALTSRSEAFYVGLLGSRKRWQTLDRDLRGDGIDAHSLLGDRLHAPIGLDIGASSPEMIALAIAAEVQASLAGRSGGAMRDLPMPQSSRIREVKSGTAYTDLSAARSELEGDKPRCLVPLLSD